MESFQIFRLVLVFFNNTNEFIYKKKNRNRLTDIENIYGYQWGKGGEGKIMSMRLTDRNNYR